MRHLQKPQDDPEHVLLECAKGLDKGLQEKLAAAKTKLTSAAALYDTLADKGMLYTIKQGATVSPQLTVADMGALYSVGMSASRAPGRAIYDRIRANSRSSKCPLCGVGVVTQLDHYLPQKKYPAYTVLPTNLVPTCADCNKAKLAKAATSATQQTLHPYYDNFTNDCWLFARVVQADPPGIEFFTDPPVSWTPIQKARADYHFKTLRLGASFSSNAGDELVGARERLVDLLGTGGAAAVKEELAARAFSYRSAYLNSWQTAMYSALSQSEWFCSTGLLLVPT